MNAVKRCKAELRWAIKKYLKADNPFELVRNLEDCDKEIGGLKSLTPSAE